MRRDPSVLLLCSLLLPLACGDEPGTHSDATDTGTSSTSDGSPGSEDADSTGTTTAADEPLYTYWRDAKAVLDTKCGGCHRPGDIAPFSLQTYDEVKAVAAALPGSLQVGAMPPWPPADDCQEYEHSRALTPQQAELLLAWLDDGAPEGDPADAPPPEPDPDPWTPTMSLQMAEPFTPTTEPDEYRCFLVPWTEPETTYITGVRVVPGNRSIVHHVIMFNAAPDAVAEFQAMDDAEPGPGYECFGGSGGPASWVGSWAPGTTDATLPEGTGIRIEPGSMMILQLHYNTQSNEPASDQTQVELSLAAAVERPAITLPFTNFQWVTGGEPMLIPAGDPSVTHAFEVPTSNPLLRQRLSAAGIGADDGFLVHAAGLHMHTLGTSGSLGVGRNGSAEDCMLRIDEWDFGWQGGYTLREPMRVDPQDSLRISCTWDNSAENQPVVDGEVAQPRDVEWGEGTFDEMCLGVLYVSAE